MNTNISATRVLCFGDSNTWGQIPVTKERYPINVRWTGLLQKQLGDGFEVIEEGLGSRATRWEYSEKEGRNGKTYLLPCLESHNPLDVVILFLGTNDLKEVYQQTPAMIASSIQELIQVIQAKAKNLGMQTPKIILLSPMWVDETVPTTQERYKGAEVKSKDLAIEYEKIAIQEVCSFIDLALYLQPSKQDGIHLEPESHQVIADLVEKEIVKLITLKSETV